MVSEPGKIEEFDNLGDDGEETGSDEVSPLEASDQVEGEEAEEVELIDEAPEMTFSKESQEIDQDEVRVKYCMFCREIIPADAIACKHCGHVLHIFEGAVFKQLYFFFWGGVVALAGSFLPFFTGEPTLVTACTSFAGSLYLVFSLLLIAGMAMSIYSKRLIMSPVFLMFIPAVHTWWTVSEQVAAGEIYEWYEFLFKLDALNWLSGSVGSGMLLIMLGSSLIVLTFIVSLFTAIISGGQDEKSVKAGARGRGRRR